MFKQKELSMNSLISICIPTYQRPDLLRQAVESCLSQTYKNIEIIICDDSKDDSSKKIIQNLPHPEIVRYYHNYPSLGQASNVNRLFELARGDRLILLHDDDRLLPNAVQELLKCWELSADIIACFGKQYVIKMDGSILEEASQGLNQKYYRTEQYIGCQKFSLWSAMVGQFPNDGYMVKTSLAQNVKYRSEAFVGDACDLDFGLRLAAQPGKFCFLNEYTAQYRLTETSISASNSCAHLSYELLTILKLPEDLEYTRTEKLTQYSEKAINAYLVIGDKKAAFQIYFSKYHPWSKRFSIEGILKMTLMIFPNLISSFLINTVKRYRLQQRAS